VRNISVTEPSTFPAMEIIRLPEALRLHAERLGFPRGHRDSILSAIGDPAILGTRKLAIFCSVRCPGKLLIATHDLARRLRDVPVSVIGGFHSPMEKECLSILLGGQQPIIVCLARGLGGIRLPSAWRQPLAQRRLLLLSACADAFRRPTAASAGARNRLVAALADQIFVAHAHPGGKTESLLKEILAFGKPVCTFDDPLSAHLLAIGATPLPLESKTASLLSQAV
jgi:predicted Rossmann fold nucleotide-binding protein DprA/Smf involved in DNA uptake